MTLHPREQQVLEGIAQGFTAKHIGTRLHLGETTIKTYAKRLYKSLGARSGPHAVTLGFAKGLLKVEDFT